MKIGAGWIKKSKNGNTTYISCKVEIEGKTHFFSILKNTKKEKENQPDYNILNRDEQKPGDNSGNPFTENNSEIPF